MIVTDDIKEITDSIIQTVEVEKIYLFGSYAYGNPTDTSDYDFYVVVPDNSLRPLEAIQAVYSVLSKKSMKVPVDILALSSSRFAARCAEPTLERKIIRDGVLLYDKNHGRVA